MTTTVMYTLPSELASYFINGDASIFDYIGDKLYEQYVNEFEQQLEYDGVSIVDVDVDNVSFVKYHDLADYGVKATECCAFKGVIN